MVLLYLDNRTKINILFYTLKKNIPMKKIIITAFVALLGIAQIACAKNNQKTTEITKTPITKIVQDTDLGKVEAATKKQLNDLLNAYYAVKDALVATDGKVAKSKSSEFMAVLAKVETSKMSEPQKKVWLSYAEKIKFNAQHINETEDTNHQRDYFQGLSDNLYAIIKAFKANSMTAYRQYCPMAFENKGAFWLSDKKEVRNPYFGNKMLKCGSVKEEL